MPHNRTNNTTSRSTSRRVTTVIVGGGQAGLAMSRTLTDRSIDHIVLERGTIANSWRTERWDSLRLLTPNSMTRLPGHRYTGPDADGYMRAAETASFLDGYAQAISAPVVTGVTVETIEPRELGGFRVETSAGVWEARSVVIATGACRSPRRPAFAEALPPKVQVLAPIAYRNPDQIADGRVLVVGASASGAQIADELARAGRDVIIATGNQVRVPRTYRGRNIHWWMDVTGVLDESWRQVDDITRARRIPSLQLVGTPEQRSLDLNTLQALGVEVAGRVVGVTDSHVQFSGSLANAVVSADLKMHRLLDLIDAHAAAHGLDDRLPAPDRPAPLVVDDGALAAQLDGIGAVVCATGFVPHHPELGAHFLDRKGALRHDGGVAEHPGLFAVGLPYMRRRKSTFLDGVGPDAVEIAGHLHAYLDAAASVTM